jgi:uncharacterized protein involved in exopolysaccharide biosynthesis
MNATDYDDEPQGASMADVLAPIAQRWRSVLLVPVLAGALGVAGSYLVAPRYMASVSLLPPQQQGGAASALASVSAISSLAGSLGGGFKSPADQMVALMQSNTVSHRLIEQFSLKEVYDEALLQDARATLAKRVAISAGKKDGLIRVDVEDTDPARAAAIANQYVEELRRITAHLAITEAQQRRVFYEKRLAESQKALTAAQVALQSSGFNRGALQVEPKAAAETFAKLKAELTLAEVRLAAMRSNMADTSAEVRQQLSVLSALRQQVGALEADQAGQSGSPGYISRYREYKYQEMLFEMFARQYELARVDESREAALIQVVDAATPPERKVWPKRSLFGAAAGVGALVAYLLWILLGSRLRSKPQS